MIMKAITGVFLAFLVVPTAYAEDVPTGKLPGDVTPTHYRLDFEIDPSAERFIGRAEIDVTLESSTPHIWLHSSGLDIDSVAVIAAGDRVGAQFEQAEGQSVGRVIPQRALESGNATLEFEWSAALGDSLDGLYRVRSGGENYVYTQFQALSARAAFPSFDEPRFKTPFDITITVPAKDEVISNAPLRRLELVGKTHKRAIFETTEALPTYLVAIAVGPFDIVEVGPLPPNAVRARTVPLRGIASKGQGEKLHYALTHTPAIMELLEDYFGIPYPYAKLDLVAVAEFRSWGMENVGAIFYRDDKILIGETPSNYQLQAFVQLHAHELAHSWFGNFVTPAWWNDIWLNEAFATWMAAKITHAWRPETFDNRRTARGARRAMWNDRFVSARQIRQPIKDDDDIGNAFDAITYSKGGAVLGMVEKYMGEEVFREGVRLFMRRYAHGVATADDFFDALADTVGDPSVTRAFRSFIEQPGIPNVQVDWACAADGSATVALSQKRALPLGSMGDPAQVWALPMCLAYGQDSERGRSCILMDEPEMTVSLNSKTCPVWILPNEDAASYLQMTVPKAGWDGLIANIDALRPVERVYMMRDLVAAYDKGNATTAQVLEAARILALAQEWDVAQAPIQALRNIKNFALPRDKRAAFQNIMQDIYRPALERFDLSDAGLAKDEKDGELALLRGEVLWFMAHDALKSDLRATLSRLGQAYLGNGTDDSLQREVLHPDLVRSALSVAVADVGLPLTEALIKRLAITENANLRANIVHALGFQTDPVLAKRVREYIMEPDTPKLVARNLLRGQGRRVDNAPALLEFITTRYDELIERLPKREQWWMVWRLSALCDAASAQRVKKFFTEKGGSPRALANVLEQIEICAATVAAQRDDALGALAKGN